MKVVLLSDKNSFLWRGADILVLHTDVSQLFIQVIYFTDKFNAFPVILAHSRLPKMNETGRKMWYQESSEASNSYLKNI